MEQTWPVSEVICFTMHHLHCKFFIVYLNRKLIKICLKNSACLLLSASINSSIWLKWASLKTRIYKIGKVQWRFCQLFYCQRKPSLFESIQCKKVKNGQKVDAKFLYFQLNYRTE
jgi:hypothetical protein